MSLIAKIILITIIAGDLLSAQTARSDYDVGRRQKIEEIFRIQDSRAQNRERLIHFLSDPDPRIRTVTARALGSIQDTLLLKNLLDLFSDDPDPSVRSLAAFAIGQTASLMSLDSKRRLESDLLRNNISSALAKGGFPNHAGRMIEELGKFGTSEGLDELVRLFRKNGSMEYQALLSMSIARFAIRGIKSADAVDYLLNIVRTNRPVHWKTVYALQRVGDHSEIRRNLAMVSGMNKNQDPLVRMNLAVLMGHFMNSNICSDILIRLADSDPDWRVRVNAFNALGRYDSISGMEAIGTFLRAFKNQNLHVAVSAVRSFGNAGFEADARKRIAEGTALINEIAVNSGGAYPWQLQAEALLATAKKQGEASLSILGSVKNTFPEVEPYIAEAMGLTGAVGSLAALSQMVSNGDVALSIAALTGAMELLKRNPGKSSVLDTVYNMAIRSLETTDVALTATAAEILSDSLLIRESSVNPIISAIGRSSIPDDVEAVQALIRALGAIRSPKAVDVLKNCLRAEDRSVRIAAASALAAITGKAPQKEDIDGLKPVHTDYDFDYYWSLPDTLPLIIFTSRGNIILHIYKELAPFSVISFLKLALQKEFFSGTRFHRVVPNFVIQGGDPRGDGWGGPGYSIRSEFSETAYETGSVGLASAGMDTEGSQFFITHSPQPHLDGRYTLFGGLAGGTDILNSIQRGDRILDIKISDK